VRRGRLLGGDRDPSSRLNRRTGKLLCLALEEPLVTSHPPRSNSDADDTGEARDSASLRVLMISHYMPPHVGGIERVAESLVNGMLQRGHEVRWVASAVPERPGDDAHLLRVPAFNLLEERLGVPYPLWSPTAAATIARQVRKADIVHVHDCLYMGSALAALSCRRHRVPLVVTQHVGYVPFGALLDRVQRAAYQTLGRAVLGAADVVIAYSAHVEQHFTELGIHPRYHAIPNAIDTDLFRPSAAEQRSAFRAAWGVPASANVMLFVGRLVGKKGFEQVVELQRRLAADNTVLVVAGDGPLAGEMEKAPGTVHLPNHRVPRHAMPQIYGMADLLYLPSRGEGLPLSIQEALCCGLPVVVSDDASYVQNVSAQPGVTITANVDAAERAARGAFARPPTDEQRRAIVEASHRRWGGQHVLAAHEALYRELIAARTKPPSA
jgi:glycosyltransferase involved in cell wall biosynthesis